MAKFLFSITAHVGNDRMFVYSQVFPFNFMEFNGQRPVLALTNGLMGFREWVQDAGDDKKGTTYCQYVSYDKDYEGYDHYLLASWYELDENGFVKL